MECCRSFERGSEGSGSRGTNGKYRNGGDVVNWCGNRGMDGK